MSEATEGNYIKTTTHNFISRKAVVEGPRQVALQGRSIVEDGVKLRGDLGILRIGRYVRIEADCELEPAPTIPAEEGKRVPMMVGNHTRISRGCKIQAAAIGSMVVIGTDVTIGQRCIIKDCCVIDSNVVLGDDTVVPPFTRIYMDGDQLRWQELPPSMSVDLQEQAMDQYDSFAIEQRAR